MKELALCSVRERRPLTALCTSSAPGQLNLMIWIGGNRVLAGSRSGSSSPFFFCDRYDVSVDMLRDCILFMFFFGGAFFSFGCSLGGTCWV